MDRLLGQQKAVTAERYPILEILNCSSLNILCSILAYPNIIDCKFPR